jgi:hypothetical protein
MTLCSHFRTDAPVNPRRLHDFVTSLVNPDGHEVRLVPQRDEDRWGPKDNQLWNAPGQGLNALIWTTYGQDGPLQVEGRDVPYADYPEEGFEPAPPATVDVSMDSPYGFSLDGMGCTEYHTGLMHALNAFVLREFPVAKNHWYNEYAGTWHTFDDVDGWEEFVGDGSKAMAWFGEVVKPLIKNHLTAS